MHLSTDQTAALGKARGDWERRGLGAVEGSSEIQLSFHLDDANRMLNRLSPAEKFKVGEYISESVSRNNLQWVQQVLMNRVGIAALWNNKVTADQAREIGLKLLESAAAAPN